MVTRDWADRLFDITSGIDELLNEYPETDKISSLLEEVATVLEEALDECAYSIIEEEVGLSREETPQENLSDDFDMKVLQV